MCARRGRSSAAVATSGSATQRATGADVADMPAPSAQQRIDSACHHRIHRGVPLSSPDPLRPPIGTLSRTLVGVSCPTDHGRGQMPARPRTTVHPTPAPPDERDASSACTAPCSTNGPTSSPTSPRPNVSSRSPADQVGVSWERLIFSSWMRAHNASTYPRRVHICDARRSTREPPRFHRDGYHQRVRDPDPYAPHWRCITQY